MTQEELLAVMRYMAVVYNDSPTVELTEEEVEAAEALEWILGDMPES